MPKLSRPVLYLAIGATAIAAYLIATPQDTPARRARPKAAPKVQITSSQFLDEDYKASFSDGVAVARNSFKPLVTRRNASLVSALAMAGGVPPDFAGGEGSWVCTGVTEIDGVKQALLENRATSEGVFLRQGDKWKRAVVSQVLDNGVVLVGPGGEPRTIFIQQDQMVEEVSTETTATPVQPPLRGAIGNGGPQPNANNGQVAPMPSLPFPTPQVEINNED